MMTETATQPEQATNPPASVPMMPQTWDWVCLDLETIAGTPTDAERWMRLHWSPNKTWKPATIGQRFLDMLESKEQKLALMDEAPIICVSIQTSTRELRCLHWLYQHEPRQVHGGLVESFPDQAAMLTGLRALLDSFVGPETVVVGHNIRRFDLPKLRSAYLRAGLRLPAVLAAQSVALFDSMVEYGRRFSLTERPFVALADILEAFNMDSHKSTCSGEQVGDLHAAGDFDSIVAYALLDVIAEAEVFRRMTGQSAELR